MSTFAFTGHPHPERLTIFVNATRLLAQDNSPIKPMKCLKPQPFQELLIFSTSAFPDYTERETLLAVS